MKLLIRLSLELALLISIFGVAMGPQSSVLAASCYGASCNGIDPSGTSCWNDWFNADIKYSGSIWNANRYSPSCVANWSYTKDTSLSYLAAETVGVFTYHGPQKYKWVWNSMYDGSGYVCSKGHKGTSYMNYTVHTANACG